MRAIIVAIALVLGLVTAQAQSKSDVLPGDLAFALVVAREGDGPVQLGWAIAEGYYLYRDHIVIRDATTGAAVKFASPAGEKKDDPNFGVSEIYRSQVVITLEGPASGNLKVQYQGCKENSICYPPATKLVDVKSLTITNAPPEIDAGEATDKAATGSEGFAVANEAGSSLVGTLLSSGGPAWVIASFLVFGILLAFTPCVLPMYPILAATLAGAGERLTMGRGLALSLVYVLAMACAFALLGIGAALFGQNLQLVLQSPYAVGVTAAIFVVLAASMFGLFELQLPAAWVNRIASTSAGRRGSLGSSAFLGFSSALIVGPCVTAPLAAALLYIAQTGDAALGAASLFALGLGQGLPLMALGTLGARVLPRAGAWMNNVKYAFGAVFLVAATWLSSRIVPPSLLMAVWSALLITAGVWLGAFDATNRETPTWQRARKAGGLVILLYGALLGVGAAGRASDPFHPLEHLGAGPATPASPALAFNQAASSDEFRQQLAAASSQTRPSLVYVTADWCLTCKVIEKEVLHRPDVAEILRGYRLVKVDITRPDALNGGLMKALEVVGPPTMLFFDSARSEVANTRLIGEISGEALITSARQGLR